MEDKVKNGSHQGALRPCMQSVLARSRYAATQIHARFDVIHIYQQALVNTAKINLRLMNRRLSHGAIFRVYRFPVMRYFLDRLAFSRSEPTALEYGLMAMLVLGTIVAVIHQVP